MFSSKSKIYLVLILSVLVVSLGNEYITQNWCHRNVGREVSIALLPELIGELKSILTCDRSVAALQVQQLGPTASEALPNLLSNADSSDDAVRWRVAAAIGHIRRSDEETVAAVAKFLNDPNPIVLHNALFAARELSTSSLAPQILRHVINPKADIGLYAFAVLRTFKSVPKEADAPIVELLQSKDSTTLFNTLLLVEQFKPMGAESALMRIIGEHDGIVATKAKNILLGKYDTKNSVVHNVESFFKSIFATDSFLNSISLADQFVELFTIGQHERSLIEDKLYGSDQKSTALAARMIFRIKSGAGVFAKRLYTDFFQNERIFTLDHDMQGMVTIALANATKDLNEDALSNRVIEYLLSIFEVKTGRTEVDRFKLRFPKPATSLALSLFEKRASKLAEYLTDQRYFIPDDVRIYSLLKVAPERPLLNEIGFKNITSEEINDRAYAYIALKGIREPRKYSAPEGCLVTDSLASSLVEIHGKYHSAASRQEFAEASQYATQQYLDAQRYQAEKTGDTVQLRSYFAPKRRYELALDEKHCRAALIYPIITDRLGSITYSMPKRYHFSFAAFERVGDQWKLSGLSGGADVEIYDDIIQNRYSGTIFNTVKEVISERLAEVEPYQRNEVAADDMEAKIHLKRNVGDYRLFINNIEQFTDHGNYTYRQLTIPKKFHDSFRYPANLASGSYVALRGIKMGWNSIRAEFLGSKNEKHPDFFQIVLTVKVKGEFRDVLAIETRIKGGNEIIEEQFMVSEDSPEAVVSPQ